MEIYNIKKFKKVKIRKRKKDPRYELKIDFFDNISYVLLLDKDELEMLKKVIDESLKKRKHEKSKQSIKSLREKIEEIIIAYEEKLCPFCGANIIQKVIDYPVELDIVYCSHCDRNIDSNDYFKKLREVVDGGV